MSHHKRVTFSFSIELIKLLNEIVANSKKSSFVENAVFEYIKKIKGDELNNRLKEGYMAAAKQDLEITQEFYPAEQECYEKQVLKEENNDKRKH